MPLSLNGTTHAIVTMQFVAGLQQIVLADTMGFMPFYCICELYNTVPECISKCLLEKEN